MPADEIRIPAHDIGLIRGFAVFDFFRVTQNTPLFLEDYLQRFQRSISKANIAHAYTLQQIRDIILELIAKNNMPEAGVRMVMSGGPSENRFSSEQGVLMITQEPLFFPPSEYYAKGIKVITDEYQRESAEIKTTNYFRAIQLQPRVKSEGAYEVLYKKDGFIREFTRCNVFLVKQDGTIVTPDDHILPGITRQVVINLIKENGIPLEIRPVTTTELHDAKEVFLTSTTKKVLPVRQIDDIIYKINGNNMARKLLLDFETLTRQLVSPA